MTRFDSRLNVIIRVKFTEQVERERTQNFKIEIITWNDKHSVDGRGETKPSSISYLVSL